MVENRKFLIQLIEEDTVFTIQYNEVLATTL